MSKRWLRPLGKAQAEKLGDKLGDVQTRILVNMAALKLEVVAEALIQTVLHTLADVEGTTLQDTQGGV